MTSSEFEFPRRRWRTLGGVPPRALVATRETLHHAAQLLALAGASFIPAREDDSHTSMTWLVAYAALATQPIAARASFRFGLRVPDLTLFTLDDETRQAGTFFSLHGARRTDALTWMKARVAEAGLDASRLRATMHFTIGPHPTDTGGAFQAVRDELEEVARWLGNASALLEECRASMAGAGPTRCWPHHFDIATLVRPSRPGLVQTIGIGLSPGDVESKEPYFYVSPYPRPALVPAPLSTGTWHTDSWWGAALEATEIVRATGAEQQQSLVQGFVTEAVSRLLESSGQAG
jgi:hypothetical protein